MAAFTVEEIKTNNKKSHLESPRKFTLKEKPLSNRKDVSYVYFEPVLDIVVPFILVQISFLDLLYFKVMLNNWKNIISNPYFFQKKKNNKGQMSKQFGGLSPQSANYLLKEDSFTRVGRNRIKL